MLQTQIDEIPTHRQMTGLVASHACLDCNFDFGASQNEIREPSRSLYAHYSNKNTYPSAHEEDLFKTGIIEALAQISLISNKIDRLNAAVTLLNEEKTRIEDILARYQCLLRPVLKLPPELLARIFLFSTDLLADDISERFREQLPPTSLNPARHPWALSQVCQSWRRIALNTPRLWSLVSFTFPRGSQSVDVSRAQCYRLQVQLQRCGGSPIDIYTRTPNAYSNSIERFLSPLCYHSPNWRHLRIELHGDIFSPLMSPITGRLQSLESLHIRPIGPISSEAVDCFQFAPKLKSLMFSADHRISSDPALWPLRKFKLPYAQIIHYLSCDPEEDISPPIRTRITTLSHCFLTTLTELESCHLKLHSSSIEGFQAALTSPLFMEGHMTASLSRLVLLELHSADGESGLDAFLPFVKAPSLKKLIISSSGPDHTALSEFFSNPQKMTSLTVSRVEMPPAELSAVLKLLTSLKELSFGVSQAGGISNEYLSVLGETRSTTSCFSVVPKLQDLTLLPVGDFASTYDTEALVSLLGARWRVAGLGSSVSTATNTSHLVSVKLDKGVDDERLDQLRAEGLRVGLWDAS
ncbi:hypothetical protein PQX77_005690 [Marasmius sp. AFHP31]|nr:hypothetical protein PQX77_005690 [Marasmius sp. AFHP31]